MRERRRNCPRERPKRHNGLLGLSGCWSRLECGELWKCLTAADLARVGVVDNLVDNCRETAGGGMVLNCVLL